MSKSYEQMTVEQRFELLVSACAKANEVMGRTPYVMIGCTLGRDGLPNSAYPISTSMTPETMLKVIASVSKLGPKKLAGELPSVKEFEAVSARATSKADQVWLEMRKNLNVLSRLAAEYPQDTPGDRLVRDCIFLVYTKVLEGMQSAN